MTTRMAGKKKTIARFDECGEIYSVRVHDDATVHPIYRGRLRVRAH